MLAGRTLDRCVLQAAPEPGYEMHALVRRIDIDLIREPLPQRGDKRVALLPVLQTHPAQMRREIPLLDEISHHGLGQARRLAVDEIAPLIWVLILYLAVVSTAVPYLLNAWSLARVNPSTVAVFIYLQPLIGFLLAVAFLGEQLGVKFVVAALLIFAGVFLVTKKFVPIET